MTVVVLPPPLVRVLSCNRCFGSASMRLPNYLCIVVFHVDRPTIYLLVYYCISRSYSFSMTFTNYIHSCLMSLSI